MVPKQLPSRRAHLTTIALTIAMLTGPIGCDLAKIFEEGLPTCGARFDAAQGIVGSFGTGSAASKVSTFLHAASDTYQAVATVEAELRDTCAAMAEDLGLCDGDFPADIALPVATCATEDMVSICGRVASEMESIISEALPEGTFVSVIGEPPVCEVQASLAAQCAAQCDMSINADASVECTGTLVGHCEGSCAGQCQGNCGASCSGSCAGACTGGCEGLCYGDCDGEAVQGLSCIGACEGSCDGICEGTCEGTCVAQCDGSCDGWCKGSCDVSWDAYCEGSLEVEAEVECQAACEASAQVQAICTEPYLTIEVGVDTDDEAMIRLKTLVDSLHSQWPTILSIGARVEHTLLPAAAALLEASAGLGLAATQAGLEAMACMTEAGLALGSAFARVEACVSVSVTLSVSVHTSGNAQW